MVRVPFRSPLGFLLLALTSCGGGGPNPVTLSIPSTAALDGVVFAQGGVNILGDISVGDQAFPTGPAGGLRGFVSFDISGIPAGATVQSATLTLVQKATANAPFATLGVVLVDEVFYGTVLEAGAYDRSFPVNQAFAVLSQDVAVGPRTVDATTPVMDCVASGHAQCQFRLRFPIEEDDDLDSDQAIFWSADLGAPGDVPMLVVTYLP